MRNVNPNRAASEARRRAFLLVLIGGAVLSVALLVAALWVPPSAVAAVFVALAAGVSATWIVRREVRAERAAAHARLKAERSDHRTHLNLLHTQQREVLAVVDARKRALVRELAGSRAELGRTQQENSRLRGDNEALRLENTALRGRIDELEALPAAADVVVLPRRRASRHDDEWAVLEPRSVVDLDIARLATPFVEELRRAHAN